VKCVLKTFKEFLPVLHPAGIGLLPVVVDHVLPVAAEEGHDLLPVAGAAVQGLAVEEEDNYKSYSIKKDLVNYQVFFA
jgi:hypothetical protein